MSQEMSVVTQPGQPPQAGYYNYGQQTGPYGAPPPQAGYGPPPQGYQAGYGGQPPYGAPPGVMPGGPGGPMPEMWMNPMGAIPNCPPGLEYLTSLDQVLVKQKVELLEAFTAWECSNKYKIYNNQGQQCYYAFEESDACCRQCCGANRGFTINVVDNAQNLVFAIKRPFKCCGGCNCFAMARCAQDEVTVETKDGKVLGYVRQACSFFSAHYMILDEDKDPKFEMWGPCCNCNICMGDIDFPMTAIGSEETVAKITKQWSGAVQELYTDADNFGVTFPMNLDVKLKAVMIAAVFLIDFMFFENNQRKDDN